MVSNARIADLIRENRPDEIGDAIDAGEYYDMQTFAKSLIDLVLRGEVEREIAANAATNRHDFLVALEARRSSGRKTKPPMLRRRRGTGTVFPASPRSATAFAEPCAAGAPPNGNPNGWQAPDNEPVNGSAVPLACSPGVACGANAASA